MIVRLIEDSTACWSAAQTMNYSEAIAARSHTQGRPDGYETLLLSPVGASPTDAGCYTGWEFDHAESLRFYVGGFRWFMRVTGMFDLSKISAYSERGVDIARRTSWTKLPVPARDWDSCSINQFRAAKDVKAQQFVKAALVIATCEAIVADRISSGRSEGISVVDVYNNMSIVPAVWSLAQIGKGAFDKVDAKKIEQLMDYSGQTNPRILDDIGSGHTVTAATAIKIKQFIDEKIAQVPAGVITSRRMNVRNASPNELVTPEP